VTVLPPPLINLLLCTEHSNEPLLYIIFFYFCKSLRCPYFSYEMIAERLKKFDQGQTAVIGKEI
jgi:hypothetical protein